MLELFPIWSLVAPSGCLLDLFNVSSSVFKCVLAVWHKLFQEYKPSLPQTCVFPRSLVSSNGKWYLEQGLDTKGTHYCWASRPFCWTELGNTYFQFIPIVPKHIHHHRLGRSVFPVASLVPNLCVCFVYVDVQLFSVTALWIGHNVFNLFVHLQMDEYWNAGC